MSSLMLSRSGLGNLVEPISGRRWSPAESERRVAERFAVYRARGIGRGDRVFLHFGNCLEFFAELLAIWRAGACAVPIDPRFTPFEIETLAAFAKPSAAAFLDAPGGEVVIDAKVEFAAPVGDTPIS